jgi:hypothetical protein
MNRECSTNGKKRTAYRVLAGKPEEKRPVGRPRRWLMNNIKMDLKQTVFGDMDWIHLVEDRDQWRDL